MRVEVKKLERLDISGEVILTDEEYQRLRSEPKEGLIFKLGNMKMIAKPHSGQASLDGRVLVTFEVIEMEEEPVEQSRRLR